MFVLNIPCDQIRDVMQLEFQALLWVKLSVPMMKS